MSDVLPRCQPAEQGVSSESIRRLLQALAFEGMSWDSLLISRNGRTIFEAQTWPSAASETRTIHSVTKSFVATAIGFAISEGLLSLDDEVSPFFTDKISVRPGSYLSKLKVRDLLTMRTGQERGASGGSWRRLTGSWLSEFFAEPITADPGSRFRYSSAPSHVLSCLVGRVAEQNVKDYLQKRLFDPLGFAATEWLEDPEGNSSGGNGLAVRPADLLAFGVLHLNDGVWLDRRVLPVGWVHSATARQVRHDVARSYWNGSSLTVTQPPHARHHGQGYGYLWWIDHDNSYRASGLFGQECLVSPKTGLVVVITGRMHDWKALRLPKVLHATFVELLTPGRSAVTDDSGELLAAAVAEVARQPESVSALGVEPQVLPGTFRMPTNAQGVREVSVEFNGPCEVCIRIVEGDSRGERDSVVRVGLGSALTSCTSLSGIGLHHSYALSRTTVVAHGMWTTPVDLVMKWRFRQTPFEDEVRLHFDELTGSITLERSTNVNAGPLEMDPVSGLRV